MKKRENEVDAILRIMHTAFRLVLRECHEEGIVFLERDSKGMTKFSKRGESLYNKYFKSLYKNHNKF